MTFKLKYKILLLFLGISVFILVVIGTLLSAALQEKLFTKIHQGFLNELAHVDFALTSFLMEVEEDLENIVSNESVRSRDDENFTNFTEADEKIFQYNIGDLEQDIVEILNRYRTTHKYVNSVYMGRENGGFVRSHKRNRPTKYDPRVRPWYILGKQNSGKVMRCDLSCLSPSLKSTCS